MLDNFEQVTDAAPDVAELVAGAANLSILVTSRSVLKLYGEREFPVPPLRLPDPRRLPELSRLSQYEAVALFVERARAVRPDFAVTDDNARAVADICIQLDGLPLAIELAAARIKVLTPAAILQRLGDRLALLASGSRDLPRRQRTLRAAIEWSHDLLDEPDQQLFACLSVFVGGAGIDALEEICAARSGELLEGLASLADKSLLRHVSGTGGQPRYVMLETIREYALDRSVAAGGHGDLRRRHAEWFAGLSERLSKDIMGPQQGKVLDRLEEEHPNLRAALTFAIESGRADLALLLTSRLWRMWQMRGHLGEAMERVRQALDMSTASEHALLRAEALEAAGGLAYWSGDQERTRRWYEQALDARRELGDPAAIAEALYNLAFGYTFVQPGVGNDDIERARTLGQEAMQLFGQMNDASGEARALWLLGTLEVFGGDVDALLDKSARAAAAFRRLDDRFYLGWTLWSMALGHLVQREPSKAGAFVREAIEIFDEVGDLSGLVGLLDLAGYVALLQGDTERAARLSGAVAGIEQATGVDVNRVTRWILDFYPAQLRDRSETREPWAEGAQMDVREAVRYTLAAL